MCALFPTVCISNSGVVKKNDATELTMFLRYSVVNIAATVVKLKLIAFIHLTM